MYPIAQIKIFELLNALRTELINGSYSSNFIFENNNALKYAKK